MRWLCLILAFLVLGLSVQPACAAFSLVENNAPATPDACCQDEIPANPKEDSSKKDCHGCNPFHSCSCCVASIVLPMTFKMQQVTGHTHAVVMDSYQAPRLPQVAFDFWQPPRVF